MGTRGPTNLRIARQQLAFAVVEMLGDHGAVQVEIHAVDWAERGEAREHVADDALEGIARDVRRGGRGAPHQPGGAMSERVQGADRARGRDVRARQPWRDLVARDERRPAASVLKRRVARLRRCEGVGFVLESTDGDQTHRRSRAPWHHTFGAGRE